MVEVAGGEAASKGAERRILGKAGLNNGKSALAKRPAQPPNSCPECGSSRLWRDGVRRIRHGEVQRWLCRSCGLRFSESTAPPSPHRGKLSSGSKKDVSKFGSYLKPNTTAFKANRLTPTCQVCASEDEVKNLSQQRTRKKQVAGATKTTQEPSENITGIFSSWMQREGYKPSTCNGYVRWIKMLLKRNADLWNSENVKNVLAQQTWTDGFKKNVVDAYSCFLIMEGLTWNPPRYQRQETLPFIPLETEIDQLIAGCGKKIGAFLRGLKETGADPGELWHVEWTDIDEIKRLIKINHPVRGHAPRILPVSKEFIAMLKKLSVTSERLFGKAQLKSVYHNFSNQRKRISCKLENPRLLQIHFTTLRHWKGTMEYHLTKDILHVKRILGHKSVKNTEIYINLESALFATPDDDQFITKVATTIEEDQELIEAGFEYVTERDGAKIYRKRK